MLGLSVQFSIWKVKNVKLVSIFQHCVFQWLYISIIRIQSLFPNLAFMQWWREKKIENWKKKTRIRGRGNAPNEGLVSSLAMFAFNLLAYFNLNRFFLIFDFFVSIFHFSLHCCKTGKKQKNKKQTNRL